MRSFTYALLATGTLVAVGISFANQTTVRPGPQSIAEVVAAAEKLGFVCLIQSGESGPVARVVISERPLDEDEAASVSIVAPQTGMAACYVNWDCAHVHFEPVHSAYWGDMFLFGDPKIVNALTQSVSGSTEK